MPNLSIAPMIDWTHPYFRIFMRILSPDALLYTEMQTVGAIKYQPKRSLEYFPQEHPIAIQLGGSDATLLAECAKLAEQEGFDEINLNVGCPSDRVQSGRFGACLMAEPQVVAQAVSAMKAMVSIPVTVKIRIGIDHQDSYTFFSDFVQCQVEAGADKIIIHARKAWLKGLSPKQNRTIPPINYDYVYQLKQDYPELPIIINGNIKTLEEIKYHLKLVDGVMVGRLACDNPFLIHQISTRLTPSLPMLTRTLALRAYAPYIEEGLTRDIPFSVLFKPLYNLCHGMTGNKVWKQCLTDILRRTKPYHFSDLDRLLLDLEQRNHGKVPQFLVH